MSNTRGKMVQQRRGGLALLFALWSLAVLMIVCERKRTLAGKSGAEELQRSPIISQGAERSTDDAARTNSTQRHDNGSSAASTRTDRDECLTLSSDHITPELMAVARAACMRRSSTTGHLFVTTYQGGDIAIQNWVAALRRLGIDEFLVVAMRDKAQCELGALGIPHVLFNGTGEAAEKVEERTERYRKWVRGWKPTGTEHEIEYDVWRMKLWNTRTRIIDAMIQGGTTVSMADMDAVVKRDVRGYVEGMLEEYDVVASQEMWPYGPESEIGASVLMGFVTLKGNERMQRFMRERVVDKVDETGDDQMGFNYALQEDGVERNVGVSGSEGAGRTVNMRTKGYGVKVVYVPTEVYARRCFEQDVDVVRGASVLHCLKEQREPRELAEEYGYWFIGDGDSDGPWTECRP